MNACIYDILWHGTMSVAGALQWALLFLLHNPDVQARAQDEIDANFPNGGTPLTADDRTKLPYLQAMVLEVSSQTHLFFPRKIA
jgi:cytochrome P450